MVVAVGSSPVASRGLLVIESDDRDRALVLVPRLHALGTQAVSIRSARIGSSFLIRHPGTSDARARVATIKQAVRSLLYELAPQYAADIAVTEEVANEPEITLRLPLKALDCGWILRNLMHAGSFVCRFSYVTGGVPVDAACDRLHRFGWREFTAEIDGAVDCGLIAYSCDVPSPLVHRVQIAITEIVPFVHLASIDIPIGNRTEIRVHLPARLVGTPTATAPDAIRRAAGRLLGRIAWPMARPDHG